MPPVEPSGENLINFMNSVTSSVKTVLAKPGCFKRNTNHRRFLQKQLRQTVQQQSDTISRPREHPPIERNISPNTMTRIQKRKLAKSSPRTKTIKKERDDVYIEIESSVSNSDVPSPTYEYNPSHIIHDEHLYYTENSLDTLFDAPSPKKIRIEDASDILTECYNDNSCSEHSEYNFAPSSSENNSRSSSPVSYTSSGSDDECFSSEFLTAEELLQTLDVTDLFVPDNASKFICTSLYDVSDILRTHISDGGDVLIEESFMIASFERALQKCFPLQF